MELTPPSSPYWAERLQQKSLTARIASKARIAEPARPMLQRPALLQQLANHRLCCLLAPAGYGKTQLMADYQRSQTRQQAVIWMSVDDQDNSAEGFLRHFLELAERQLPGVATDALVHWQATQQRGEVDIGGVLLLWIQEVASFDEAVLLCLDDVHWLSNEKACQVLGLIIEQLPANVRMLFSARYLPAYLGRLHLHADIGWISAGQLAFSDDETRQWLAKTELATPHRLATELHSQLRGWPAALRIWLNQGPAASASLAALQKPLADYLNAEVLRHLSTEVLTFWRQLAVLGRFTNDLLHVCLAESELHERWQQVLSQDLFVTPLATQGDWYELHPAVAQVLRQQLSPARRQVLHQRAFTWLSQHHEPVAALQHARAAGLTHEVADWVEAEAESILANLDIAGLLAWFEQAGSELIHASPRNMQMAAWAWLLTQQQDHAAPLLERLQQCQLPAAELYALQGYQARLQGQMVKAQQLCEQALQQLPAQRYSVRILMSSTLAHLALSRNDPDSARLWNRYAQDIARQHRALAMEALVQYDYARIELNRGNISRASQIIEQALVLLEDGREPLAPLPRGRLLLYRAFLLWLQGNPDDDARVLELLQQGLTDASQAQDISVCYGFAVHAMRATAQGDTDRALDWLDQVERLMQHWRVTQSSYDWLLLVKANVWISQHKLQRAQGCIDEICRGQACHELPSPEVFPMLPGLAAVTQARLYLASQDHDACLAQAEDWLQHSRGSLMNQVMQLVRAGALQARQHPDSQLIQSRIQQLLERQGIQMDLTVWLPAGNNSGLPVDDVPISVAQLSARELDVLRKMAQGFSNQEIADQLFISLHTVKTHARKINVKLGAKSRTQAIHRAKEMLLL